MKQVNTIYETKDYNSFTLLKENREIKKSHVDYFVKELKKNGQQIPFKVSNKNEILEGQHRFTACKILNIPFQFFYSTKKESKEVQLKSLINLQKGLNWSLKNYLDTQLVIGNENYLGFQKLYEKHSCFSLSTLVELTTAGSTELFKDGRLKNTYFNFADEILSSVKRLKPFYKFYNRSTFVIALARIAKHKEFDIKYFEEKAYTCSNLLVGCNGRDAYMDMIINLYNFKKKYKINFYEDRRFKSKA